MKTIQTVQESIPKLLIVDDDPAITSQLSMALARDFSVTTANDTERAWEAVQADHPDLITLDLALEGQNAETGFALLERCLCFDPYMKIILITGNDNQTNAMRAIEQGATDFFGKPVDVQELKILLRRALSIGRLERQNARLLKQVGDERRLGSLLGQSLAMRALFRNIERAAPAEVSVLILGESGTGKELVARELRRLSSRDTKPFVSINCGAIPENLLESELFGHEKGSFTGAHVQRTGRLELAQGGIVFLDEIGELPVTLQVKLLRFLQEHEVERVGGREIIKLDVRVIAATSRDLEEEVRLGRFRQDLYYRLAVVDLKLPPLRDRFEDILFLAQFFLDRYCGEIGRGRLVFTPGAKLAMQRHSWPGNVRELEHRVQKAVLMCTGRLIEGEDLELESRIPKQLTLKDSRDESDRRTIVDALRFTSGNVSRAAELLGISRPSLHELLTKLHINAQNFRLPPGKKGE